MKTRLRQLSRAICGGTFTMIVFLSACVASPTPPNSVSPFQSPSLTPSASPTLTVSPSATLTAAATTSPTSTRTPWPVTEVPLVFDEPTPIASPSSSAAAYHLKRWDESSALALVRQLEAYAFADNIPRPFGEKRFDYQDNQKPVKLAIQEMLLRFPKTDSREALKWRMALADAIRDDASSDTWILDQLEEGLNSGRLTPDDLDRALNPYGFRIAQIVPTPNLFGDGRPAQVIKIAMQDRGDTGLYAALSQSSLGHYTLFKIHSSWFFNFGYDEPFAIEDHTGEGIPEVVLSLGYLNGSFCGRQILLYQWQHEHFSDLMEGQLHLDECHRMANWQYGPPDSSGAETLEVRRTQFYGSTVMRVDRYGWDGEPYVLVESWLETPATLDAWTAEWLPYAMEAGDYATVAGKLKQTLSTPLAPEILERGGASFPDYLSFRLGEAYALESKRSQAEETLQQIIDAPHNHRVLAIPHAAQAYLDNYTDETDLYRACQAALQVIDKAASGYDYISPSMDPDTIEQVWGYKPVGAVPSGALCSLRAALNHIMQSAEPTSFSQLPEWLRAHGVLVQAYEEADLNGDRQMEWVVLVRTPGDNAATDLWVMVNTGQGVMPLAVTTLESRWGALSEKTAATKTLEVEVVTSPQGESVCFIQAADSLFVFQVGVRNGQPVLAGAANFNEVKAYEIHQQSDMLRFDLTNANPDCYVCQSAYRWSNGQVVGLDPYADEAEQLREAETILLSGRQPAGAILLLQHLIENPFSGFEAYYRPHLWYLLGLAYEMAGDTPNAVHVYWKLWNDFSETPYALMARDKLELNR